MSRLPREKFLEFRRRPLREVARLVGASLEELEAEARGPDLFAFRTEDGLLVSDAHFAAYFGAEPSELAR